MRIALIGRSRPLAGARRRRRADRATSSRRPSPRLEADPGAKFRDGSELACAERRSPPVDGRRAPRCSTAIEPRAASSRRAGRSFTSSVASRPSAVLHRRAHRIARDDPPSAASRLALPTRPSLARIPSRRAQQRVVTLSRADSDARPAPSTSIRPATRSTVVFILTASRRSVAAQSGAAGSIARRSRQAGSHRLRRLPRSTRHAGAVDLGGIPSGIDPMLAGRAARSSAARWSAPRAWSWTSRGRSRRRRGRCRADRLASFDGARIHDHFRSATLGRSDDVAGVPSQFPIGVGIGVVFLASARADLDRCSSASSRAWRR